MTHVDLIAILDALDEAEGQVWLDGGWGVDALLGEQTRPHADLDLVIALDDVPRMCDVLARRGIHHRRGELHSSFVLGDGEALEVDVHPVRFDASGDGIYRMESGEDWTFPAEAFTGVGDRITDRSVPERRRPDARPRDRLRAWSDRLPRHVAAPTVWARNSCRPMTGRGQRRPAAPTPDARAGVTSLTNRSRVSSSNGAVRS